jgi:C-terminal processing protease CtpA/Prc
LGNCDSVSSGSSLASLRSDIVDDTGMDSSELPASLTLVPLLRSGVGLSLRRNQRGQYSIYQLSGACESCGVFNVGDQLVALDGFSVDGLSSRTVRRRLQGTTGSSLEVTMKYCASAPGSFDYSCEGSPCSIGDTFRTILMRVSASSAASVVFIGVGLVLKRAVDSVHGRGVACFVLRVRDGSPAAAAGVTSGDTLKAVDGIRADGKSLSALLLLLQGPAHAEVELVFERASSSMRHSSENPDSPQASVELKIRVQRRPLPAPDMCLDFCSKNRASHAADLARAAASRSSAAASQFGSLSAASTTKRTPSPSVSQGVGFGMNLKRDANGTFYVRRLDVGGPSAACGKISVGDECLAIDGVALNGKSYSALSRLVVGPPSSTVELQLRSARGGAIKKIMINRRSHATSIPEEDGDWDRSASRGTPDDSQPAAVERVGIGATFHKGRNGVFEVRDPLHAREIVLKRLPSS